VNTTNVLSSGPVKTSFRVIGRGAPLLMMHGGRADLGMLVPLAQHLSGRFQCILYDQRDCGATIAPGHAYGFPDLASDARDLLDALEIQNAYVYGTSFGGQVAQLFAASFPERIRGLVLGSTWPAGRWIDDHNPEAARTLSELRRDASANARQIAEYYYPPDFLDSHPEIVAGHGRPADRSVAGKRREELSRKPVRIDFGRIRCPTVLIAGREDRLVAWQTTMQMLEMIGDSRGTLMFDTGHVAAIQRPKALAERIAGLLSGD